MALSGPPNPRALLDLLARGGRVLGLRLCCHDCLGARLPQRDLQHRDAACLAVRAAQQDRCAAWCGGTVHETLTERPETRSLTCPFGHTELVAPVLEDGQVGWILFAGPCWTRRGKPPRPGLVIQRSRRWLADRLAVLQGLALEFGRQATTPSTEEGESRRRLILQWIHSHLDETLRLPDLAQALHLSPSRSGRVVRELFGQSLPELIHRTRTREAARLLTTTDLTAAAVAARTGYHDQAHFSRTFRRYMGLPPHQYRKRQGMVV